MARERSVSFLSYTVNDHGLHLSGSPTDHRTPSLTYFFSLFRVFYVPVREVLGVVCLLSNNCQCSSGSGDGGGIFPLVPHNVHSVADPVIQDDTMGHTHVERRSTFAIDAVAGFTLPCFTAPQKAVSGFLPLNFLPSISPFSPPGGAYLIRGELHVFLHFPQFLKRTPSPRCSLVFTPICESQQ